MPDDTIVPRPGVECVHHVTLNMIESVELSETEKAELQSEINDRFTEPDELGKLSLVFRVEVTQPTLMQDEVTLETTTSEINDEVVDEMIDISETATGVDVSGWASRAVMQRKSFTSVEYQE
jgi:hypothetical protein